MPKFITLSATGFAALCLFAIVAHAQPAKPVPAAAMSKPVTVPPIAPVIFPLEQIQLLALSQADGRAVLVMPDRQMMTVSAGQAVPRTRARLLDVLADKLILEEAGLAGAPEQRVWLHKGQGGAPARLERFSTVQSPVPTSSPPARQILNAPAAAAGADTARARQP